MSRRRVRSPQSDQKTLTWCPLSRHHWYHDASSCVSRASLSCRICSLRIDRLATRGIAVSVRVMNSYFQCEELLRLYVLAGQQCLSGLSRGHTTSTRTVDFQLCIPVVQRMYSKRHSVISRRGLCVIDSHRLELLTAISLRWS